MQKNAPKIKKGDVYILDNSNADGHVQKGIRPHVVVTQVTGSTVTLAPCTSTMKNRQYSVKVLPSVTNGLTKSSFVLIAQSFAADTSLLRHKIGT